MESSKEKDQSQQKEKTHQKDSNHPLQVKKDNEFIPKPSSTSERKSKTNEDTQPQWKMGVPKRGSQEESSRFNEYYDPYYMGGYSNGMVPAMGMMVYPYDYMAWNPEMYSYPSKPYKGGPKSYHSKKQKSDFGYEQSAKHAKAKVVFVPKKEGQEEGQAQGDKSAADEETKTYSVNNGESVTASDYANLEKAKFFIIKSYSEEDVFKSVNNNLWCSTNVGNQKLNDAFIAANGEYPILLVFSINGSGHFLGICQMKSTVDFNRNFEGWNQNHKWRGSFEISWIYIKDIPNKEFRHLKNDLNEGKPVTNSRDTQEIPNDIGLTMIETFERYENETSILDYVEYYESETKKL